MCPGDDNKVSKGLEGMSHVNWKMSLLQTSQTAEQASKMREVVDVLCLLVFKKYLDNAINNMFNLLALNWSSSWNWWMSLPTSFYSTLLSLHFYISSSEEMRTTTACIQSIVLKQLVSREWDTLQQWQLTYSFEETPEGCSLSQSLPGFYINLLVFIS